MKQVSVIQASTTLAVEREIQHIIREYNDMRLGAEMKQQMIEMLQDSVSKERTVKRQFRKDLEKARAELKFLKDKKELDDKRCEEAVCKIEEFKGKHLDALEKVTSLENELEGAKASLSVLEQAKKGLETELQVKIAQLGMATSEVSSQKTELDQLREKITALEATNAEQAKAVMERDLLKNRVAEQEKVISSLSAQLSKVQDLFFHNQVCDSEIANCFDLLSQNLTEAKIAAVEQRKDDARRLKKRFMKEMNVNLARMFYEASEQVALPVESRSVTPEQICEKLGVEMGNFDPKLYLDRIKSEIEISYPADVLAMIAERKAAERAKMQVESDVVVLADPQLVQKSTPEQDIGSAELALRPAKDLLASQSIANVTLGKE